MKWTDFYGVVHMNPLSVDFHIFYILNKWPDFCDAVHMMMDDIDGQISVTPVYLKIKSAATIRVK